MKFLSLTRFRDVAEARWTLFIALVAGGTWAFAELLDEVVEGETQAFDKALLLALRVPGNLSQPVGPPWLQELMRDFTALGGVAFLTLVTLAVAGFLLLNRQRATAVFLMGAVFAGLLLSSGFKSLVERPRPDLVPHGSFVSTASFPSGHSMMAAVVYLTLAILIARLQDRLALKIYVMSIASALALAVGVSRVYLGVHWPSDVLAGWTLGATWAVACWGLLEWLNSRRAVDAPSASARD